MQKAILKIRLLDDDNAVYIDIDQLEYKSHINII